MFHKEGFAIIRNTLSGLVLIITGAWYFTNGFNWAVNLLIFTSVVFFILVLQFFRNPKRNTFLNANHIIAPADGKVVVIEEVVENEFFNDKRIQISIFMVPLAKLFQNLPRIGLALHSSKTTKIYKLSPPTRTLLHSRPKDAW